MQYPSRKFESIKVYIDTLDYKGLMDVRFSRHIRLPSNMTDWTNTNLGNQRINIEFLKSENTQSFEYDTDTSIIMAWKVYDVRIKG